MGIRRSSNEWIMKDCTCVVCKIADAKTDKAQGLR